MTKTCPLLKFVVRKPPKGVAVKGAYIEALSVHSKGRAFEQKVGAVIVVVREETRQATPYVSFIEVAPDYNRCGIGTKLYEQAAQVACKQFRVPLQSDTERTEASDSFWRKQVTKDRAVCAVRDPNYLTIDDKDSRSRRDDKDKSLDDYPMENRNGCAYYKLKTCDSATDLSARRRRK